jgi:hypothetical protein
MRSQPTPFIPKQVTLVGSSSGLPVGAAERELGATLAYQNGVLRLHPGESPFTTNR